MLNSNKLKLNKILCIFAFCILVLALLTSCGEKSLTEEDYLTALQKTENATTVTQVITVTDGGTMASEVRIEVKIQDDKMQVITHKKMLNENLSGNDYVEENETVYFYNNEKYYKNGNVWVKEQGTYQNSVKKFKINKENLSGTDFLKTQKNDENVLVATIKDDALKAIFGEDFNGKNCTIKITLNKNGKLTTVSLCYNSASNKNVKMETTYLYNNVVVDLPITE